MAGISIPSLLLILLIVVLVFGTKKLRNIGSDLGGAIKSFRKAAKNDDAEEQQTPNTIEGESREDRDS